jgi:hypothetical protein
MESICWEAFGLGWIMLEFDLAMETRRNYREGYIYRRGKLQVVIEEPC